VELKTLLPTQIRMNALLFDLNGWHGWNDESFLVARMIFNR
jgi:hypothetical protein